MRRKLVLVVLGLGAFFGFSAGVRSLMYHREFGWHPGWGASQPRLDAMAEACVRAAERVRGSSEPMVR